MRDLCDLVYVLHLERLERQVAAERVVAATLLADGAKDVTFPTVEQARADFDALLVEVPRVLYGERAELLDALGVGRG